MKNLSQSKKICQPIFQIFKKENGELFVVYDDQNKQEIGETLVNLADRILGLESMLSKFLSCITEEVQTTDLET